MRMAAILLALAALLTGLRAAWRWFQSSKVTIDPGWTGEHGSMEPVLPELQQSGWTSGTMKAFTEAAAPNKSASLWTAASVGLSAISAVAGALASN
jgi:hypothetical protein